MQLFSTADGPSASPAATTAAPSVPSLQRQDTANRKSDLCPPLRTNSSSVTSSSCGCHGGHRTAEESEDTWVASHTLSPTPQNTLPVSFPVLVSIQFIPTNFYCDFPMLLGDQKLLNSLPHVSITSPSVSKLPTPPCNKGAENFSDKKAEGTVSF